MDYHKLDAALSATLADGRLSETPSLEVSVRTAHPPNESEWHEMQRLGVRGLGPAGRVFTARLSPRAVAELSDKTWVRLLTLAHQLHHF